MNASCTTVELFQIATVTKGDVSKIRARISKLEEIKDKYALPMSYKAAQTTVSGVVGGHFCEPTGRLLDSGAAGFAANHSAFYPRRLTDEQVPMAVGSVAAMFESLGSR